MQDAPLDSTIATSASDRAFGLLFSAVFFGLAIWPVFAGGSPRVWLLLVSVVIFIISMTIPRILAKPKRVWMRLGDLMHRIVSPLAIGVVYYIALVPTALVGRVIGKKTLSLEFDSKVDSYWIVRTPPGPDPQTMKDQF